MSDDTRNPDDELEPEPYNGPDVVDPNSEVVGVDIVSGEGNEPDEPAEPPAEPESPPPPPAELEDE